MKLFKLNFLALVALFSAQTLFAQPVLTGLSLFSSDSSGNPAGGDIWTTTANDLAVNPFVTRGPGLTNPFLNGPSASMADISIPLTVGDNSFTIFAPGGGMLPFHGLNLFFDGIKTSPFISAFVTNQAAATPPPFFANSAPSTFQAAYPSRTPGAGTLTFFQGNYKITLTTCTVAPPAFYNVDRTSNFPGNYGYVGPDGTPDWVIQMTLNVAEVPAPECIPALEGLVGWWRGEGYQDTVSGQVGTPYNAVTHVSGKVGTAFQFSSRSKVELGDPAALAFTNSFTIQSWIFVAARPTTSEIHGQILFRGDTRFCLDPYFFAVLPSGALRFHIEDDLGTYPCGLNLETSPIPLQQWKHVAAVFDSDAKMMQIFVDGELVAQNSCNIRPFRNLIGGGVSIGNHSRGFDTQPFKGLIDELAVYSRALTPGEILALYTSGTSGTCAQAPVIVTQPLSQKVTIGSNVLFSVTAVGTPNLRYQWISNGVPILNATSPTLQFVVSEGSQGNYSVVVTNILGAATSMVAVLEVNHAPLADASATLPLAISNDNTNGTVVLNATLSSDVDGDPLVYAWFIAGQTQPLATGVVAVVRLPLGVNQLVLRVDDDLVSDSETFTVEVITAADAVERLVALAERSDARSKPLTAILRAALASIDRSNLTAALQQLGAFQNQVRAKVLPLDPDLAGIFLDESQLIIDAISSGSKNMRGKIDRIWRGTDGKVRMNGPASSASLLIIEASSDLQHWEKIGVTRGNDAGTFDFEDAGSVNRSHGYYRLVMP